MKYEFDKTPEEELLDMARGMWALNYREVYEYTANHHHQLGYKEAVNDLKSIDLDSIPKQSQFLLASGLCDIEAWNEAFDKWADEKMAKQ